MKIYRTVCPRCGKEIDDILICDFDIKCPECGKTLPNRFKERLINHPQGE